MTTANQVTILRILLIPFFVVETLYYGRTQNELHRILALVCFAVASICDGVDGYIARRYHQRSELGAFLDPLADKLLLVSAVVLLSFDHRPHLALVPLWLTVATIGRDLILVIGLILIQVVVGKVIVRPRLTGKIATVLQMVVVLWILLQWPQRWLGAWIIGAAVFTIISGLQYVQDGTRQLASHPASSPTDHTPTDSK